MRWFTRLLGPLVAVLMVTGSVSAVAAAHPRASAPPSSASLTTDAVSLPLGAAPRELPSSERISLTLTLTNPRSDALNEFLSQVENPASPSYRHFVTFPQYLEEFAPPSSTVHSVEGVLEAAGGTDVSGAADRSSVTAVLPARSVDQLLGVDLVSYGTAAGLSLYTALGTPSLPPSLAGLVSGVGGLSDTATAELAASSLVPSRTLGPVSTDRSQFVYDPFLAQDWYLGSDFTQAYGATQLFPGSGSVANATYPRSVAIATLLVSAFNGSSGQNLPPWDPAVVDAYFNGTLGPGWPTSNITGVPVTVNNVTPPLPGSFGNQNDTSAYEIENSLDLEMAGELAPGASLYNFYFAASLLGSSATEGDAADYLADDLSQALAYPSYAPAHLSVISCSFGLPDNPYTTSSWDAELLTAAAMGVTIVAASGDQGDAPDQETGRSDGQWPIWPASAAFNLSGSVSVGGVSVNLSGEPTAIFNGTSINLTYDPSASSILGSTAWYDTDGGPGAYAGTEGGLSTVYPEPVWQFLSAADPAIVQAGVEQGASMLGRAGPDVAMPANLTIATISANATGAVFFTVLEGTSIAAPVMAGLLADVVAVENNRSSGPWSGLGFIDPELYLFGSYFAANPNAAGDPFWDVVSGHNYAFSASPGWDPLTGWGEVNAPLFLAADENATVLGFHYTGPSPTLPPLPTTSSSGGAIPWAMIYLIFGVGFVVAVLLVWFAARPSRPRTVSTAIPPGAQWVGPTYPGPGPNPPPVPGGGPGATFLCPYCGAIRPAEPVRCPQCGAF